MSIDYNHVANAHSLPGPRAALPQICLDRIPASLLDVGCGIGTWIKVASEMGVTDCYGIDGVPIPDSQLLFPANRFSCKDLTERWDLGRRFQVALCLEVAEHLDASYADTLIDCLVKHSDTIVFAAACPGQAGQHHVNCQWPAYWQKMFNSRGYVCSDAVRWRIWEMDIVEPWYRQNMFIAEHAPERAGLEPRICPVIHPQIRDHMNRASAKETLDRVEEGGMPSAWYAGTFFNAALTKVRRRLGGKP